MLGEHGMRNNWRGTRNKGQLLLRRNWEVRGAGEKLWVRRSWGKARMSSDVRMILGGTVGEKMLKTYGEPEGKGMRRDLGS